MKVTKGVSKPHRDSAVEQNERLQKAVKEFMEAIKLNPNDAKFHINLGSLWYGLDRFDEAENEYRDAIKIDPNYADAHLNLGVLLYNLQRYKESVKEFRELIRILNYLK
ncbi:MAG: hypothetical protein BWK75_01310 [Candidatus Altiarchaeales archaeon A3]|nr:MAG: hypothetical protein BWK75_01310 [Candidatus Altiarchaeales archaeon A3]